MMLVPSLPASVFRSARVPVASDANRPASAAHRQHPTYSSSTPLDLSHVPRPEPPPHGSLSPGKCKQARESGAGAARKSLRPNPSAKNVNNPFSLRSDHLGTLVRELVRDLRAAASWEDFVHEYRGRSYLSPELEQLDHPA